MTTPTYLYIHDDSHTSLSKVDEGLFLDESEEHCGYHHDSSSFTSHNITMIRKAQDQDHHTMLVDFEPKDGELYHLLFVVYSTGDSFGSYVANGIDFIELYRVEELDIAKRNQTSIIEFCENSQNTYQRDITLQTRTGSNFTYHRPWAGYFDNLEYVRIIPVIFGQTQASNPYVYQETFQA